MFSLYVRVASRYQPRACHHEEEIKYPLCKECLEHVIVEDMWYMAELDNLS